MKNIIYQFRSKYSEPYRIKKGYGLSPIRNKRELKSLIKFCKDNIKYYEKAGFAVSNNLEVWKETVKLYENYKLSKYKLSELYDYIDLHCGEYWS